MFPIFYGNELFKKKCDAKKTFVGLNIPNC